MIEDLIEDKLGIKRDEEINSGNATYLDHAGCPLPGKSYLKSVYDELMSHTFANPHSAGSLLSTQTDKMIEDTRIMILDYINADKNEYEVIFTSGATGSVKIVVDSFPWNDDYRYLYPQNIHTSLLSVREYASTWSVLPFPSLYEISTHSESSLPLQSLPEDLLVSNSHNPCFLGVPAECNMSGAKVSLSKLFDLLDILKENHRCYWLLDAAKLLSTSKLDLRQYSKHLPDFIVCSFYKLFGYPTGIGALIVKKEVLPMLKKK
jgi:molybdenum cofactor sulfurtransferase